MQNIAHDFSRLPDMIAQCKCKKLFVVSKSAYHAPIVQKELKILQIEHVLFSAFSSNPNYEEIEQGVEMFKAQNCDGVLGLGGGSAMDVAKCIKLFARMDNTLPYYSNTYQDNHIPLLLAPTSAGTGSEATPFAVMYVHNEKYSVTHDSILPEYVILDATFLKTLPLYQKKCTMLDALSQAIESIWSLPSQTENCMYAQKSISLILENYKAYIFSEYDNAVSKNMLTASFFAGKAICLTRTTAPHAMSYALTKMYNLPHGHAVMVCLPYVYQYMLSHMDTCNAQEKAFLYEKFDFLLHIFGLKTYTALYDFLLHLLDELSISFPKTSFPQDIDLLTSKVNIERLSNHPMRLDKEAIHTLYQQIVKVV